MDAKDQPDRKEGDPTTNGDQDQKPEKKKGKGPRGPVIGQSFLSIAKEVHIKVYLPDGHPLPEWIYNADLSLNELHTRRNQHFNNPGDHFVDNAKEVGIRSDFVDMLFDNGFGDIGVSGYWRQSVHNSDVQGFAVEICCRRGDVQHYTEEHRETARKVLDEEFAFSGKYCHLWQNDPEKSGIMTVNFAAPQFGSEPENLVCITEDGLVTVRPADEVSEGAVWPTPEED